MNVSPGEYLRNLRKEKKMSLFKVAKAINISGNYLSEIERDKKKPSSTVLFSIANFYDIDKDELFRMYDMIVPDIVDTLKDMPDVLKVLSKISTNKKITDIDLDEISKEFINAYNYIKNDKRKE